MEYILEYEEFINEGYSGKASDKEILDFYKNLLQISTKNWKDKRINLSPLDDTISKFSHNGNDTTYIKKLIKKNERGLNESVDYKDEFKGSIGSTEDLKKSIISGFKKAGIDIKITSCDETEGDDDSTHRFTTSCKYESTDGELSGKFDLDIETIGGDDPIILFGGTIKKGNEINGRERIQLRSGRRGKNLKDISSHITNSVKKIG